MEQGIGPRGQPLELREITSLPKEKPFVFKDADLPLTPPDSVRAQAPPEPNQVQRRRAGSAEEPLIARSGSIRPPANGIPTRGLTIQRKNTLPNTSTVTKDQDPTAAVFERFRRQPSVSNGVARSASQRNGSRPPGGRASPANEPELPKLPVGQPRGGVSQVLDGYFDGPAPDEVDVSDDARSRVAAWQTRTIPGASPNLPPSRHASTRVGGARRGPTRAATIRTLPSDSYDDGSEQVRIRVKVHLGYCFGPYSP